MPEWINTLPGWLRKCAAILVAFAAMITAVTAAVGSDPDQPAPSPTPAATAPAPLPPDTGIDGPEAQLSLPSTDPTAPDVVEPDSGIADHVEPAPEPGVGGEVYVSSPAFKGRQRLNAGFWYPSGRLHGAWDVGIMRGTPVYAAKSARVIAANDGIANHPVGSAWAIPGSPSNFVLICARVEGRDASLYYQHLSPGLRVRPGQRVKRGQILGRSGNTGNSTGDHLHLSAQWLRPGQACASIARRTAADQRYDYLTRPSLRVFSPARWWAQPEPRTVRLVKPRTVAWLTARHKLSVRRFCRWPINRAAAGGKCKAWRTIPRGAVVRVR